MKNQQGKAISWVLGTLAVIVGGVIVEAKVIAPPMIKSEAEKALTKEWGAEVNVGEVSVHLLPVGITVKHIQFTDPAKPEQNLLVVSSAYAEPALLDMLKIDMKPILDVVDIQGLKLHQQRTAAGKVYKKPDELTAKTKALAKKGLPSFKLPDSDTILKTEPLKTVETAEKLKQEIASLQKQWQQLQADLPDQSIIKQYQAELAQLQKGGLNPQSLQKLSQLKNEIEAQKKKLAQAKQLLAGVETLKKQLNQLKNLPEQDLRRLQQKYTFNAQGMNHLMQTLLGEQVQDYLTVATGWAAKVKPLLEKKPQTSTKPNPALDTLVRQLKINGQLPSGKFDALVHNVTLNQALYQVTTPYQVDFQHTHADKPVVIKGVADLLKPDQAQIKALLEGIGIHLKDLPLVDSPMLGLVMKQAQSSLTGKADIISWEKIRGEVNAQFKQVALDVLKTQQPEVQKYLKPVLEQIKDFNLEVKFLGSVYAPKISIRSDLDKELGKTLEHVMQSELKAAKAQLRTALIQRAQQETGELSGLLQPLLEGNVQVDQLDKQLESLLKAQLQKKGGSLPVQLPKGIKLPF